MEILIAGLVVYILTTVITGAHITARFREAFRAWGPAWMVDDYDFITCHLCVSAWVSLICLYDMSFWSTLAAYGLSYFLKTQERP